ncbi:MAG TPA: peptide-methionine (S)-S-oxide reductase MsrA [Spirochaetota bacterium]
MNNVKWFMRYGMAAIFFFIVSSAAFSASFPNPPKESKVPAETETAVFAGGCFWGVEGVFEHLKGVRNAEAGYSGGNADTAFYDMVSTGTTGHAESVKVTYDPSVISYGTLLKVFFSVAHDPTQLNFQGPDQGTQYRSVIFYVDTRQKNIAEEYVKILTDAKVFRLPIVTQIVPLKAFYPAEEYHQKFMQKNPYHPYIVYWDKPKIEALRKMYPALTTGK